MSSVRPFARLRTQCPYCDHVSPAGSKFCNDCGAALHLVPCPHCGAVNDLTLTEACARCNGELQNSSRPDKPATSLTLVTDPMPLDEVETVAPAERDMPSLHPPSPRLPLRHVALAVLIVAALAGYYAYSQRVPVPVSQPLPAPPPPAAALSITPPPLAAGPEPVAVPPAEPPPAAVVTAKRARPQAVPAEAPLRRDNSSTPVEPPPPRIGPCTDAVAALGLCTNNETTTPRRQ